MDFNLSTRRFGSPVSLGVTMGANEYPTFICLNKDGRTVWEDGYPSGLHKLALFLCDSAGNNKTKLFNLEMPKGTGSSSAVLSANITGATWAKGKALYIVGDDSAYSSSNVANVGMPAGVTAYCYLTTYTDSYSITTSVTSGTGTLSSNYASASPGTTVTITASPGSGWQLASISSPQVTLSGSGNTRTFTMPSSAVTVSATFSKINYTITRTVSSGTGTLSTNYSSASIGTTVTVTASPGTGWQLSSISSSQVTLSGSGNTRTFTMPASAVTITATFTKISYTITKNVSPSGAGTITCAATGTVGASIALSQTANTGYYFSGWSTTGGSISGNTLTMPAANVTVTASYKKRSTGSLSKTSFAGGETIKLTITTESTAYTHKYQLSFGTGMATSETSVAAGTTSVNIAVPLNWCAQIPNATSKGSGTLTLKTFSGSTQIGTYTITGLTFTVPASVVPTMADPTVSIARTIGGVTYADVGSYYVQSHCGVRIQASASGAQSSTISSVAVSIGGYSGNSYAKTQSGSSIDFTSGILSIKGSTTITVTATDSRGRTVTKTATITVSEYNEPNGTISAWRVDSGGQQDDNGDYAKYALSKSWTAIGTNALTWTISCTLGSESSPGDTDWLMPSTHYQFNIMQEYTIILTLTDAFETKTVTTKLPSARFIMCVDNNGNRIGFFKATTKTPPSGKNFTFELPADCQIYIGDTTLEDYIRSIQ